MRLTMTTPLGPLAIRCAPERAPRTLAALAVELPMQARLQTPKIAGTHIYWQCPVLEDVENADDVMSAPPGTFLYWPERQFLELIFAPLQAETATVSVLGELEGGLDRLNELGALVRARHGREYVAADLALDGDAPEAEGAADGATEALRRERRALWAACPEEIGTLVADRGIMHPAGPLFVAESEARGLHELLWRLRQRLNDGEDAGAVAFAAGLACDKAAARLGGFCHLTAAAATVGRLRAAARPGPSLAAVLAEGVLIAGALSHWLDLHIPWNDINESMRHILDVEPGAAGPARAGDGA